MKQLSSRNDLSTGIQSVTATFGIENNDNPIMEFEPANNVYQTTPYTGFRAFLRLKKAEEEVF